MCCRTSRWIALMVVLLAVWPCAIAVGGSHRPQVRVTLQGGDVLSGALVEQGPERVVLEHPILGVISAPLDAILDVHIETPSDAPPVEDPAPAEGPPTSAQAAPEAVAQVPPPVQPKKDDDPTRPEPKWSGQIEFGASGAEGNTRRRDMRVAWRALRDVPKHEQFTISGDYRLGYDRGERSQHRLFSRARQRWLLPDSPWSYFVEGTGEYDEFAAHDVRLSGFVGLGYQFIDEPDTSLLGRAGLGGSRTFNGPDDSIQPEAVFGLELDHKLNTRVSLRATGEIFPELDDLGEYRTRTDSALDIALDNAKRWMLRLGARHEYTTQPGTARSTDLYYFASVVFSF